jgi:hypothetical protein
MSDPLLDQMMQTQDAHLRMQAFGVLRCTCGKWGRPVDDDDARDEFDEHRMAAVYTTVLASGRLLPEDSDHVDMYGVFQRRPFPPPGAGPDGTWLVRSSLYAAARTAKFWGNGAYVGQCVIITYCNGCELRTPWFEVHDTDRLVDLDDTPSFP